jgi:hypothetical protein
LLSLPRDADPLLPLDSASNVCKIATVVINYAIWDFHASPTGIAFLVVSLICAYFYKQVGKRPRARA